ncbi:dnaJ homolog subfamily C member 25-like [Argonauta hians]
MAAAAGFNSPHRNDQYSTSIWILLLCSFSVASAYIEGLYCGNENCYDLLQTTREATKGEIVKAYRSLARKWHPDRFKEEEEKATATAMFQKIASAYEILKDDEQRNDYNYMLDHPEEYYSHYFYYYRRTMAPKVDVRIVIAVTISVISVIQYLNAWNNYNTAILQLSKEPKYRIQATEIAKTEGLLNTNRKKDRRKKEEIREEEETIIRKVIEQKMDIRGGFSKPKIYNVLWIQLVLSPYYILRYLYWYIRWIWKFNVKKEEYGLEEKMYIIQTYMKLSSSQWEAVDEFDKENYMGQKLWIRKNFDVWKEKQEEELKARLAVSAKYKSYRRYMRKGGAGQIMFGPE